MEEKQVLFKMVIVIIQLFFFFNFLVNSANVLEEIFLDTASLQSIRPKLELK